ncbi:MAG: HigA family addiction module antidote protein [Erysipelotrichaceae bacterium]|nr:HigA family addiction module antidote protein [Erysipelotrichaceae bacterium]
MVKTIETPKISEILYEEFMEPFGLSAYKLAKEIDVPVSRIQDILHDRRKITVDTSIRLGRYFGVSEKYFINLQNDIDARNAKIEMAESYAKISPFVSDPKPMI